MKARHHRPAQTEREWWALLKSNDKWIVRSMTDWKKVLADPKRNPLKGCTPDAINHFTKNLKFAHGGLGHADYSMVAMQLNYFQFQNLWGVFGLGMGLFDDHSGYECQSKGTCSVNLSCICTSNC
jgi:hypothetical protein